MLPTFYGQPPYTNFDFSSSQDVVMNDAANDGVSVEEAFNRMSIVEDEPITLTSISEKVLTFQNEVDAAHGDIDRVEQLTSRILKCLEEEGAIVAEQNPGDEPLIKYLKFTVGFFAADNLIEERLFMASDPPYSNADKDEFRRILDCLIRAEPHQLIPPEALVRINSRSTCNFNSIFHHAMKIVCMIVINNPSPAMGVLCGCCSGYVLIWDLLANFDVLAGPDHMNMSEPLRESTRQRLELFASIAEKGRHQGPCFVPLNAYV